MAPLRGGEIALSESLYKEKGVLKDVEGVVVHITVHPDDEDMVRRGIKDAEEGREVRLYLSQVPFGIWLQMDKYDETPAAEQLAQNTNLEHAEVQSLLFVTPTPAFMPFTWREFKVSRCGFR